MTAKKRDLTKGKKRPAALEKRAAPVAIGAALSATTHQAYANPDETALETRTQKVLKAFSKKMKGMADAAEDVSGHLDD